MLCRGCAMLWGAFHLLLLAFFDLFDLFFCYIIFGAIHLTAEYPGNRPFGAL